MNTKRYLIAGAVSLLVHSMFLTAMLTKDPITLTMGTDTPQVNLIFAAIPPTVVQSSQPTITPDTPIISAPIPTPVTSTMKRLAKEKSGKIEPKKTIASQTKITPQFKKIAAPVKKKHLAHTKTLQQKSRPTVSKVANNAKTTLKPIKTSFNQSNKTATTAIDNAGTQTLQWVSKPNFATRPGPVNYPKLAKRRGIEGQVLVEVWIDTKGQQLKQKLLKSSGAQILDNAAITTIKKWHFSSYIVNGKAIAHRVQIPVRFKLD